MPSLLERAGQAGNPVIEGSEAVFVWQGDQPPILSGDFNGWDHAKPLPMTESEPGVWTARLPLPPDAYMEYSFFASPADDDRLIDPLNRRRRPNGIGQHNHWFGMPDWRPVREARRRPGVAQGTVTREVLKSRYGAIAGGQRAVYLYRPATDNAVPLLVVWDGPDYLRRAHLAVIVDHLIAQQRIQPIAMIMVDNADRWQARGIEYHTSEATVMFAEWELLPFAADHLNLLDGRESPGVHGVLGASMGGLMALTTGLLLPHVFGRVISQSGMYTAWTSRGRPLIFDAIAGNTTPLPRIWLDCGVYDVLLSGNRQLHELLIQRGADVTYHEYNAGHNYPAWARSVVRALEVMFPKDG